MCVSDCWAYADSTSGEEGKAHLHQSLQEILKLNSWSSARVGDDRESERRSASSPFSLAGVKFLQMTSMILLHLIKKKIQPF